jgi:hypothetical protein
VLSAPTKSQDKKENRKTLNIEGDKKKEKKNGTIKDIR